MIKLSKKRLRQIIALVLFSAWLISIIVAFTYSSVDNISYTPFVETKNFTSPNPEIPPVHVDMIHKMSAKGGFSANNPITITVTITETNVTNLLDYYGAVAFFGSVFATEEPEYQIEGVERNGYVALSKQNDGTYSGTSTLLWRVESDVYTFLLPQPQYSYDMLVGPSIDEVPLMQIGSSSETLNWKFNDITTRFTIVLIGFSFLMLQPIFEAIFRLKN